MGGAMMRTSVLAILIVFLLGIGLTVLPSDAATTYNGSTIVGIDESQRTVTFRARDGKKWTLPVENPNVLNQLAEGDVVSIELDLNDKITKIVKRSDQPQAAHTEGESSQ
jgi:hypothetical protein